MPTPFQKELKETVIYWYLPLIVGVLFIILGLGVICSPNFSFLALSFLFSISFLIDGLIQMIFALFNKKQLDSWGWIFSYGIINTLLGILLMSKPEISLLILTLIIGFMILFRSIMAIGISIELYHYNSSGWSIILALGLAGIAAGFILLLFPHITGLALVILVGISLLILGINSIYFSLQLKGLKNTIA